MNFLALIPWKTISKGRIFNYADLVTTCCLVPEFDITLLSVGTAEGLLAVPVFIDDPQPMLAIGVGSDGTGGIYFVATP